MVKIKEVAEVRTNFVAADFWLVRKGAREAVGKPVNSFSTEHIGVKVVCPWVLPMWLFYSLEVKHSKGVFVLLAKGTTNLCHITLDDVKSLSID